MFQAADMQENRWTRVFYTEGFGMLRVSLRFQSRRNEVTVLLDERISKMNPLTAAKFHHTRFSAQEAQKIPG